jgi:DNA-binding NarL/FixJ family response regulator
MPLSPERGCDKNAAVNLIYESDGMLVDQTDSATVDVSEARHGAMITVSVIDDEAQVRRSIAKFINDAPGFKCVSAYANAEEALVGLAQDDPDVLLMDINRVGVTGVESVARLKAGHSRTQIIILTVYEDTEQIFNALSAGASGYMLKRLPPARLLEAIREVHQGGSPMSNSIARKVVSSFRKPAAANSRCTALSSRQKLVLESLIKGSPYKQIASELAITVPTVRSYLRRICGKLDVQSPSEAVAKYLSRS